MPCEGCKVQFTVFRRKRTCNDCKRYFCNNCLNGIKRCSRTTLLCGRCLIFAKRPLLRTDLLQLKPKDLIFYLQSKHISTTGCVEKDELISLVLNHIQQNESYSSNGGFSPTQGSRSEQDTFDSLKQTCQNFFSNITDNISDTFPSFDSKSSTKFYGNANANANANANVSGGETLPPAAHATQTHIRDQPRVTTRELPTYASVQTSEQRQYQQHPETITIAINNNNNNHTNSGNNGDYYLNTQTVPRAEVEASAVGGSCKPPTTSSFLPRSSSSNSATVSPIISFSNVSSPTTQGPRAGRSSSTQTSVNFVEIADDPKSDCDCSDDELIKTFREQRSRSNDDPEAGPSVMSSGSVSGSGSGMGSGQTKPKSSSSRLDICEEDVSSQSSFEELGAIGGISDDSKTATDTNSSQTDQWHILDTPSRGRAVMEEEANVDEQPRPVEDMHSETLVPDAASSQPVRQPKLPPRMRKVTRRRSDGHLKRRCSPSDDESPSLGSAARPLASSCSRDLHRISTERADDINADAADTADTAATAATVADASSNAAERRSNCPSCQRCGKNKSTIKRHVEKMRRHLESSHMSEADIKLELERFLAYLEKRTASVDYSDSETAPSPASERTSIGNFAQGMDLRHNFDDNDGIHVYAGSAMHGDHNSRFINLEDFDSLEELEDLTVKQLKEILMLNRVDYKGCCEKQELLDRVKRLWKNLKSTPAVDKLPTDELCKICMDAPIECVILECGHMATCTKCGKVLNECPICRQYIVRVVRFFRA